MSTRRRVGPVAIGLLFLLVACRTSLSSHRDAGPTPDAFGGDVPSEVTSDLPPAPDLLTPELAAPDLPSPDLRAPDLAYSDAPSPDLPGLQRVPQSFQFVNHSDSTAYVVMQTPVDCRTQVPSGWQDCRFFHFDCQVSCASVQGGSNYCEVCDQGLPSLLAVPAGQSRSVVWSGNLFSMTNAVDTGCACELEMPVPVGNYQASAQAYAGYQCEGSTCGVGPDGTIGGAHPQGTATWVTVPFTIPTTSREIVLDINVLAEADAGTRPDLLSADLAVRNDSRFDALAAPFADLPGNTFQIKADATPPDASVPGASSCKPSDRNADYRLAFSSDGTTVRIVRVDPVQEAVIDGTLTKRSDTSLAYRLDNLFAGGELVLRSVDGKLIAQLVVFGSGLPVISCIESPLDRVP